MKSPGTRASNVSQASQQPAGPGVAGARSSMEKLRKIKTVLTDILSKEASFILQYVDQDGLVTQREYSNLYKMSKLNSEDSIVHLLDTLISKGGDEKCTRFLTLLQLPVIRSNFSRLGEIKQIDIAPAPSSPAPPDAVPTSASSTVHNQGPSTSGSNIPSTPVKKKNPLKTLVKTSVKSPGKPPVNKTRRSTTAYGTIHGVSEVKTGTTGGKYFQAVLQQGDVRLDILILDVKKRNIFVGAEKRRSSVKLKKICFEKLGINKYQEGIKFTNKSELTYTRVKNTTKMEPTAEEIE